MSTELTPAGASPFDAIRRTCADGTEFWSARDLMPLMGYAAWRNFMVPVERAMKAAENQGHHGAFAESRNRVDAGAGSTERQDYELSRFAAYLVAMNGDPNKPEVAAAQAYFAIRTREAETRPVFDPAQLTRQEILRIALNDEEERMALEAENKVLAPKAEAFDSFIDTTGKFSVGAVAKMLGTSQNRLFRELRNAGVFIAKGAMRNTQYQQYMHHFEVKAHEYERSSGEMGCSYTTYVQPSGIDFVRKRLGLPTIDPLPAGGAS